MGACLRMWFCSIQSPTQASMTRTAFTSLLWFSIPMVIESTKELQRNSRGTTCIQKYLLRPRIINKLVCLHFFYMWFLSGACGNKKSFKPCPKKCPLKDRPVCGTDNKTYKNGCLLAAAKCSLPKKDRSSLRLQYNGPCGAPSTPKPCPRWEDCKVVDKPVCGSDGKTYPNICRLRVAMCHARRNKHRPIKLRYRDECKKRKNGKKGKKGGKGKNERFGRKGKKDRRD